MSFVKITVCDQCRQELRGSMEEEVITVQYGSRIAFGREVAAKRLETKETLHFCSLDCLFERIRAEAKRE